MNELLSDSTISTLSKNIATELANRNRPCSMELSMLLRSKNNGFLSKYCQELYSIIRLRIETDGFLQSLVKYDKSLSCSVMRNLNDLDEVAYDICRYIVEKNRKTIDDYVEHIQDKSLCKELDLELNKDFLVSLADENIELKKHGIFYKDSILIYPHQFFRRYYNSNFVNLPSLLQKSYNDGLDVSIKVDPFRKCSKKYYSDILELDHWYGPAFSEELLMSKNRNIKRKVHFSIGIYCFCYDAKYTVFRTKMMDTGLREFMI
ncbi:MAG: hypothetical protein KAH01_05360, partial [Caldisericia bacterium]|nr:hypothetical protein [Caldisericia bacterium]